MIVRHWQFSPPPRGVSLTDHCRVLPIKLLHLYQEAGGSGVFVISPAIAGIIETQFSFTHSRKIIDGPINQIGSLFGIPIWVNADNPVTHEALVAESPTDDYPTGKLVVRGLGAENALDYMAKL